MNFEKGSCIEIEITDLSAEGQGIGRVEGIAVFVSPGKTEEGTLLGPVIGDRILAEITKVKKSYGLAQLKTLIRPSEIRQEPFCEHAGTCGGCSLQGMRYEGQLQLKEKQVRDKLVRIAGIENPRINEIIGMENNLRYRNKAQIPVGQAAIGFYQAKSHTIVNCTQCLINAAPAEAIAQVLRRFMRSDHVSAYDPQTGKGLLRHLVVRTAPGTGEVMVVLVVNGKGVPNHEKLIGMMDEAIYELPPAAEGLEYSLESVVLNINQKRTGEVLGERCITLAGKPTILDRVGPLNFEISPLSFYQVNWVQMEKLYHKVLEYAQLTGKETVLDLYCGIGTIGLFCASQAKKVIGIESVRAAVLDANRNAVINGIVNAEYLCGAAEELLPKLAEEGLTADVVILDPPRAGCRPELLQAVDAVNPKRILYVSCDPATLARDVKILSEMGYGFKEATPVDMFPWTGHVEAVIMMTYCGSDKKTRG